LVVEAEATVAEEGEKDFPQLEDRRRSRDRGYL
jgi:hypothetical protein